jgi:hypothetical protein
MRLYKYYSATNNCFESIINFQFYFSRFNELNDPCELSLSNCDKEKFMLIKFQFLNPEDANGIFCLSEKNDNLHMWTQYADGHSGIVIEFETDEDKDFFRELNKVYYSDIPPQFQDNMKVKELVYIKSLDSEKELEWRIFGKTGLKPLNPKAIKSVIYGQKFPRSCGVTNTPPEALVEKCKNTPEKIKAYVNLDRLFWKNLLPDHIDFYHTIIDYNSYKLRLSDKFIRPQKSN